MKADAEDRDHLRKLRHLFPQLQRVMVSGFGFRVSGFGFRVSGFGFQVSGFGFRVSGFGFRVSGFGACVWFQGAYSRFLLLPRATKRFDIGTRPPLFYQIRGQQCWY